MNETRFHILQGQALTISSYKFSSRREFTFIFFSLRRGDDWRIIKQSSTFWDYITYTLFNCSNKSQCFFIDWVSLADWQTKLTKWMNRFQMWVSDFIWVNTMIKTNQIHLNIFTDLLWKSYWQTGWLNTSDWLKLLLYLTD